MHACKCFHEIPCTKILNKQKKSFFKNGGQEGKTGPILESGTRVRGLIQGKV
jgi:hypothetical protein